MEKQLLKFSADPHFLHKRSSSLKALGVTFQKINIYLSVWFVCQVYDL